VDVDGKGESVKFLLGPRTLDPNRPPTSEDPKFITVDGGQPGEKWKAYPMGDEEYYLEWAAGMFFSFLGSLPTTPYHFPC
jgi:hypothetical protein